MTQPPDGAYQVGGGRWRYGQDLVDQAIDTMLLGGAAPDDGDAMRALGPLRSQLSRLPLSVLQLFRPFVPWKPATDFESHDTAVDAIVGVFQPRGKLADRWQEWLDGVSANFGGAPGLTIKEVLALWKADRESRRQEWKDALAAKQAEREAAWQAWLAKDWQFFKDRQDGREAAWQDWLANTYTPWRDAWQAKQDAREAAWQDWLNRTFPTWTALQDAREKAWQDWIAKTFGPFRDAQEARQVKWQEFLDKLNGVFGGTGTAKPIADVIAAIQAWRDENQTKRDQNRDDLKELVDGIRDIWGAGSTSTTPIKDSIAAILGLKDRATAAQEAADRANMGIAAIRAEQAGGFADEFDYPAAAKLDAAKFQEYRTGNANMSWGPDGNGVLTYRPNGIAGVSVGQIIYREKLHPITAPTGSLTVLIAHPPKNLTQAAAFLCWHMNATDQACDRFEVKYNKVQLQKVNAAGTATDVGAAVTIPTLRSGDVLEVKWTATRVQFVRNKIMDVDVAYTPSVGTFVGFGGFVPLYTGIGTLLYPAPDFGGIAAHP